MLRSDVALLRLRGAPLTLSDLPLTLDLTMAPNLKMMGVTLSLAIATRSVLDPEDSCASLQLLLA